MISAVVICLNEAQKLDRCLKSVADFADEIITVDLGSSDNSVDIAKKYKAKIYYHKFVPFVELIRNYAISKAYYDWILILDPDEEISQKLKDKLKEISKSSKFVAAAIPRKNIFFGRFIKHTNWWPDYHVRFFKKGKVSWTGQIHVYPEVEGEILKLPANENIAILHYGYDSIKQFLDRQNRYSSVEAHNLYEAGERFSWGLFFWKPTREFLVRFIKHLGFLDGFYGITLTFLMMVHQISVMVKLWELEKEKR